MTTKTRAAWILSGVAAAGALLAQVVGTTLPNTGKPTLPPPFATPSSRNSPKVVAQPSGAELHLPPGFKVSVWSEGYQKPRYMLLGNHGEVLLTDSAEGNLVAESTAGLKKTGGSVYVFPGADPAKRKQIITGLDRPYGLALWHEYLYVSQPNQIDRYKYNPADFSVGPAEKVVTLENMDKGGHWTRSLLFNKAGTKMYVGVGSASNVDAGEDPRRAAINEYNPDGTGHQFFATGTRNPTSMHWYPGTQTLWAAVQERDLLGDDLVPDYFTRVQPGAFYGWPFAYTGPNEDPRRKGEHPELVRKAIAGDFQLGAHVAVLDFCFYTGSLFPAKYRNGAFLAFHGSWNRSKRVGQEVVFVPFQNGKPSGPAEHFLTGWMLSPEQTEVWGRPVGVMQMADGSLLVSDDGANKIWHVTYAGR